MYSAQWIVDTDSEPQGPRLQIVLKKSYVPLYSRSSTMSHRFGPSHG